MSARKKLRTGRAPLYGVIYDVLREHLLDSSFPPGLVLGESSVARAFQASRIPAAAALQRLRSEGLIKSLDGHGYIARNGDPCALTRLELVEAGLSLPAETADDLKVRNHRGRIYPDVEHTVAACLAHGRFLVNESALADHYGVSRTVAHDVLTRLERTGLIEQDLNRRWYAGPLTVDRLREHFEIRWLLEPAALGQAMDRLNQNQINAKLLRAEKASRHSHSPSKLERLERDLHVDIVLSCANQQLREAIQRSQLPLIATHSTFAALQDADEIETMLAEHLAIFRHILAGRKKQATTALEAHVRRSMEPNVARLKILSPLPEERRPPFLMPAPRAAR
jgi:DNA-binding GntR family transcriptional regulator